MTVQRGQKPRILALRWEAFCPAGCEPDSVVWIDVRALDASRLPSPERVGPSSTGAAIEGRYEKFGTWLHASRVAVHMPVVGFDGEGPDAPVVFTDGRHRFAWLRDHGLRRMPVAAAPSDAGRLAGRFGVPRCRPRLWSRRIVGWAMASDLRTRLVLDALDMAVTTRKPAQPNVGTKI